MASNAKPQAPAPDTYTVTLDVPTGSIAVVLTPEEYIAGKMRRLVVAEVALGGFPAESVAAIEAALDARDARKAERRAAAQLA